MTALSVKKQIEDTIMKKTISLFPALLMCAALLPFTLGAAHADAEGQLSDSVYWSFDAAIGTYAFQSHGNLKKVRFQTASHGSTIVPFIIAERCRRSRFRTL